MTNLEVPMQQVRRTEKPKFAPFFELSDGRLAEQGFDGKDVYFLLYSPKNDSVERTAEIEQDAGTLRPINSEELKHRTVLLPSAALEYGTLDTLLLEVFTYLNFWHESPSTEDRQLDVFYCLLTYVKDLIPALPYRRYLAPYGRGKSAWLETLGWICYRPIVLAGSDTDKSIVRKMNNWKGTALIDEADFSDSSFYSFITKILNIGYDKKTGHYQRADDNDPNKILEYDVYGPKLLCTRDKYKDAALESRCLTTIGRENKKPKPLYRMKNFEDWAQELRNKLILWRFRNYHATKTKAERLEDEHFAEEVFEDTKVTSRVKQIILPLSLIESDLLRKTFKSLAGNIDAQLKLDEPDYQLEQQAREAIARLNVENMLNIICDAQKNPAFLEAHLSDISKEVMKLQGIPDDKMTINSVTSVSKSLKRVFEVNLGFSIRKGTGHKRVVSIPAKWVKETD